MSTSHYRILNGFSNQFWGWGGEDDDMYNRIVMKDLGLIRFSGEDQRMMTLPHKTNETGNEVNRDNIDMKDHTSENIESGLRSLSTCRYC